MNLIILTAGLGVSALLVSLPMLKLSDYKIGFFKNHVTVEVSDGKQTSVPYKEIKLSKLGLFSAKGFVVGEWFIPTGNTTKSILFPHEKLQERLFPFVFPENELSGVESFKLQWNSPEGILKHLFFAIVLMVATLLYVEFIGVL